MDTMASKHLSYTVGTKLHAMEVVNKISKKAAARQAQHTRNCTG